MQTFRTFIGIQLPPDWSRPIARLIERCETNGDGVRWVPQENLHLTLKFLGEVENVEVPEACDAVADACGSVDPFELSMIGGGGLPTDEKPRVLALKLADPSGSLRTLVKHLEDAFADLGYKREPRDYVPHLTVARARSGSRRVAPDAFERFVTESESVRGEMVVDEVCVVASFLEKRGPTYQTLDTVAIGRS